MSKYANYDAISAHYDERRRAAGSDVIFGLMEARTGKPLSDLRILDIACGTGNYSLAALQHGIGHVSLVDGSEGMISKAKEKLAGFGSDRTDFRVEKVPPLGYKEDSFDAVMMNQMLHHLDPSSDFAQARALLAEARRVLRPGGCLIITSDGREQRNAHWFVHLMPEVLKRLLCRIPALEDLQRWLTTCHFSSLTSLADLGHDMFHRYFDPEGPLDPTWRFQDSFFSLATPVELEACISWVRSMKENGTLDKFMKEHDQTNRLGSFYIVAATAAE